MLGPLVLPNKNLGAIQLLGINTTTTIPFLEQQAEKLKNNTSRNSVGLTELSASFYIRGLLSYLGPMIQIETTDQTGVEMFGIKNLERILKKVPKTQNESAENLRVINELLKNLDETATSLQNEANKMLLQPRILVGPPMLREEINQFFEPKENKPMIHRISKDVETKYNILLLDVIKENNKQVPKNILWPIVLIPRSKTRLAAISTAFYTPPALFKVSLWKTPEFKRLFTLIPSQKPVLKEDKEQFVVVVGSAQRAQRVSLFNYWNKQVTVDFYAPAHWKRPSVKVDLKQRKFELKVPAAYVKNTKKMDFTPYLRHSSYMVAFYAYVQVILENDTKKYFSVSFDVGIKMSSAEPLFAPSKDVTLDISPTEAYQSLRGGEDFTHESGDLEKWIMTQNEIKELFNSKSPAWKSVAMHVTRIYIGTTSGGGGDLETNPTDRSVPEEYNKFYNNTFDAEDANHTVGWASLEKARKLSQLAFPVLTVEPRPDPPIDFVRDLNIMVKYEEL